MSILTSTINNPETFRLFEKYVKPKIGVENGLKLRIDFLDFQKNQFVTAKDWKIEEDKICLDIENKTVPLSKISKYTTEEEKKVNKGISLETLIFNSLTECSLTFGSHAKSGNGPDVILKHSNNELSYLEIKKNKNCSSGQISMHWNEEQGWHIPIKAKEKQPNFSEECENATVNGKKIIEVINQQVRPPINKYEIMRGLNIHIRSDLMNFSPIKSYIKDSKCDIIHIEGQGTFKGGSDKFNYLPEVKGTSEIRVRAKDPGTICIHSRIITIEKSSEHWDFFTKNGKLHIAERLGYGKSSEIYSNIIRSK